MLFVLYGWVEEEVEEEEMGGWVWVSGWVGECTCLEADVAQGVLVGGGGGPKELPIVFYRDVLAGGGWGVGGWVGGMRLG